MLYAVYKDGFTESHEISICSRMDGMELYPVLPAMHERYSYLIDILLLLLIFMDKQYTLVFVIEIISSILRYKYYLFNGAEVSEWQAVVYLAAWILLTWQLFAKKKGQSSIGIAEKSVG